MKTKKEMGKQKKGGKSIYLLGILLRFGDKADFATDFLIRHLKGSM